MKALLIILIFNINSLGYLYSQSKPAPFLNIAHQCNSIESVGCALAKGANAIECDIEYVSSKNKADSCNFKFIVHHAGKKECTELGVFLRGIKKLKSRYPEFCAIMFDSKLSPKLKKKKQKKRQTEIGEKFASILLKELYSDSIPTEIKSIITVAKVRTKAYFSKMQSLFKINHSVYFALGIDEEKNVPKVIKALQKEAPFCEEYWYGNGVTPLFHSCNIPFVKALEYSINETRIKRSYHWTLNNRSKIISFLRNKSLNFQLNGIMTDKPNLLLSILKTKEFKSHYILAKTKDLL